MNGVPEWLERYLREQAGLEPLSLGERHIAVALRHRLADCGGCDEGAYRLRLLGDPAERTALLAELAVRETWFFRDVEPYALLAQEAAGWSGPVRVLCAPCASGEEAYSAAIALRLRQIADFSVDGVDVHPQALAQAREGLYGPHSFREQGTGLPADGLAFLEQTPAGARVGAAVRARVRFCVGDLLAPGVLEALPEYQFIFCRNFLIYLTLPAREKLLRALTAKLCAGGLLFTGHAELSGVRMPELVPAGRRGAFALRKENVQRPATAAGHGAGKELR